MYEYRAKVIRVIDGDTLVVNVDLGFKVRFDMKIRLKQIDTPEIFRPKTPDELIRGRRAKRFVEERVLGKAVMIKTYKDKTGKYGRYLADVLYTNDEGEIFLLSDELKREGLEKKT